jgi:hypothetical protein
MALEQLKFIASYDDVVRFCGADVILAEKFQTVFAEAQGRSTSFDPIMAAASNPEMLSNKKNDLWTKKGSQAKRGLNNFDQEKFTKSFIKKLKLHLDDPEKNINVVNRSGFDAYAYLMAYEEDILALYTSDSLSKLQKAALHFIEVNKEEVELDYLRYVASYDDLVLGTLSSNIEGKSWEEFIPEIGKNHYESCGRNELMSGRRHVIDFFDATKYLATYPQALDSFTKESGSLDAEKAAIAYITMGASSGLVRSAFNHNVYLANYPEILEEDIYVNKQISPIKVAKIWLERFKDGVDLNKFDAVDYRESNGLEEAVDVYSRFVNSKKEEYMKMMKKRSKLLYRLGSSMCVAPSMPRVPRLKNKKDIEPLLELKENK